ncbi:MAG: hypothetical protein ACI8RD_007628, partial [Bacillariaceae sp.]
CSYCESVSSESVESIISISHIVHALFAYRLLVFEHEHHTELDLKSLII